MTTASYHNCIVLHTKSTEYFLTSHTKTHLPCFLFCQLRHSFPHVGVQLIQTAQDESGGFRHLPDSPNALRTTDILLENVRKSRSRGGGKGYFRCVLTISTDVLTTSETLCLSSAAVPGLPSPRVNLLVSGCTGVAIVAHLLATTTPQSR